MLSLMSVSGESPFRASVWARLWAALSGWFSPSPPGSLPPSSATLDDEEEYAVEVSPQVARTLDRLKPIVDGIISGEIKGFVMFAEENGGITYMWQHPPGADNEQMALALKDYGHRLHLKVAAGQGTAPPHNRSDRTQ